MIRSDSKSEALASQMKLKLKRFATPKPGISLRTHSSLEGQGRVITLFMTHWGRRARKVVVHKVGTDWWKAVAERVARSWTRQFT